MSPPIPWHGSHSSSARASRPSSPSSPPSPHCPAPPRSRPAASPPSSRPPASPACSSPPTATPRADAPRPRSKPGRSPRASPPPSSPPRTATSTTTSPSSGRRRWSRGSATARCKVRSWSRPDLPGQSTKPPLARACAVNPHDLVQTARRLVESGAPQPTQADLRRAVSTAYYALFHCLAGTAADLLTGASRGKEWHQVYRALEHGKARDACRQQAAMRTFPKEIRKVRRSIRRAAESTPAGGLRA